jgi:hypothetical protein
MRIGLPAENVARLKGQRLVYNKGQDADATTGGDNWRGGH